MGGERNDADELRISPELIRFLFQPLHEVLKENGNAMVELTDQQKEIVKLVTAHPTRQTIADALAKHHEQATSIKEEIQKLRDAVIRIMWIYGIALAGYEFVRGYIFK